MELYNLIKIFHILCAVILFGTPLACAWYCFNLRQQNNKRTLFRAKKMSFLINIFLIGCFGSLQLISGFAMIFTKTTRFSPQWIFAAITAYAFSAFFWLILIFFQTAALEELRIALEKNKQVYKHYAKERLIFGLLSIFSIVAAVYVMTSKV